MNATRFLGTAEATLRWKGLHTWYRVVSGEGGDGGDRAPVVICHGGPGLTHDYLTSVAALSRSGRPCVLYDQVGNGRSDHRADAPAGFWTVELFVEELERLVEQLGIADGYHVLGHSWGGMLALELAARRPAGLRSAVVASAFASSATYSAQVTRLLAGLPVEDRETIARHEAAGTTDSPDYQEAVRAFYRRHVCRLRPVPHDLVKTLVSLDGDPTVYRAMAGPSEFTLTGTLRDWDISARLGLVTVPVLVLSGRHDEVTPAAVAPLHEGLADSRWVIFENSSHMAHLEEPDRFLDEVGAFLDQADAPPRPAASHRSLRAR